MRILITFLLFFICLDSAGQFTVSGQVTDDEGSPLPGINVVIKNTTNGTTTDIDGRYRLSTHESAVLIYSSVGLLTQEIAVNNHNTIDVVMEPDVMVFNTEPSPNYAQINSKEELQQKLDAFQFKDSKRLTDLFFDVIDYAFPYEFWVSEYRSDAIEQYDSASFMVDNKLVNAHIQILNQRDFDVTNSILSESSWISNFHGFLYWEEAIFEYVNISTSKLVDITIDYVGFTDQLEVSRSSIDDMYISESKLLKGITFNKSEIDYLVIENSSIFEISSFEESTLPEMIILKNVKIEGTLDFIRAKLKGPDKCILQLEGTNIENINLTYDKFQIYESDSMDIADFNNTNNVYFSLLNSLKQKGYDHDELDRDYKKFKYLRNPSHSKFTKLWNRLLNWLDSTWWDYGYQKERVPLWTIFLLIIFTFINFIFRKRIIKTYNIDSITRNIKLDELSIKSFIGILYYTSLIFFGFKLTVDNIQFNRYGLVAYLFLQYALGLVCLAYLVDFVINSPTSV